MVDLEHARALLERARADLAALRGMRDPAIFADEVFGFQAQQAAEKAIKAWISAQGLAYPKTHDIDALLAILSLGGVNSSPFAILGELNPFAVQYRYEGLDSAEEPVDRSLWLQRVDVLLVHVAKSLAAIG